MGYLISLGVLTKFMTTKKISTFSELTELKTIHNHIEQSRIYLNFLNKVYICARIAVLG